MRKWILTTNMIRVTGSKFKVQGSKWRTLNLERFFKAAVC